MCLLCAEHARAYDSEVSVSRSSVLDVDKLCFTSYGESFSLGNDEDRSLDLEAALELIADNSPVL